MYSKKLNKTRYDDLGKLMKQTCFIVKNLGGNHLKKQSTIIKKSFRSSTKLLSLDCTIRANELTAETFYCFRTSELSSIWTSPMMHGFQYVTNSSNLKKMLLATKLFTSSIIRSISTWLQNSKAQRRSNFF